MKKIIISLISLGTFIALTIVACTPSDVSPPDFAAIKDVKHKKQTFFDYMSPLIDEGNKNILSTRKRIVACQAKAELSADDNRFLKRVSEQYSIRSKPTSRQFDFHELLLRVDYIPPSLALAQSANESAWGTSRFALEANNFFGQWCFKKGCGIVPSRRNPGSSHEVRSFTSAKDSVFSYMHNINSGQAYRSLRKIRLELRMQEKPITGTALAAGLIKYSSRGTEYVKEIRSMIRTNRLFAYD
jgi:Bax protein